MQPVHCRTSTRENLQYAARWATSRASAALCLPLRGNDLTRLVLPPFLCSQSASALTYDELQGLTYLQVKGTGIANTCPVLSSGTTNLKELKAGTYKVDKFCVEPTSFTVKEESQFKGGESEFVKTKLMTRLTYTLDAVSCIAFAGSALSLRFYSDRVRGACLHCFAMVRSPRP